MFQITSKTRPTGGPRASFKLLQKETTGGSGDSFKLLQKQEKGSQSSFKLLKKLGVLENISNHFKNQTQGALRSFQIASRTSKESLRFFQITSKTRKGIPEILSSCFKDKLQEFLENFSSYFKNKTHRGSSRLF